MSCLQITGSEPCVFIPSQDGLVRLPSRPRFLPLRAVRQRKAIGLKAVPTGSLARQAVTRRYRQQTPVCLFVGKGGSGGADNNEETQWDSLDKETESSNREMTIEDVLREQIQKKEYFKEEGKRKTPRGGGGGKGGGGGRPKNGDGSGESDDEDFARMINETVQVVLATMGFICSYAIAISGQEVLRLLKDYMKYLSGGGKSARLIRALEKWEIFVQKLTEKKIVSDVEKDLHYTPAWWNSLTKWRESPKAFFIAPKLQSQPQSKSG